MSTMMLSRTAAVTALSLCFLMIAGVTVTSATNGTGIQYQYEAGNQQVTLTTSTLDLRVTTGGQVPHFLYWDPNITSPQLRQTYHVQFHQLIEFNDSNSDQTYTPGTDLVTANVLSLANIDWTFSGFTTENVSEIITAVHFNFTLDEVHHPGYDELYVQLRCHLTAANPNELKFDIVIAGWPWTANDTYLALRWDLMIQTPGLQQYRHAHQVHYENRTYSFDGAYFSYRNSANAGNETVPVSSSYYDQPDRTRFYIVYPNFGDDLLEHDPTVGLQSGFIPPPDPTISLLIVVGAGALATGVIAAAIWVRRRQ